MKALSVPLKFNYLAIVSSLYHLPFVNERERLPENNLQGEGYKTVNKKTNVKILNRGGYTKAEKGSFCL